MRLIAAKPGRWFPECSEGQIGFLPPPWGLLRSLIPTHGFAVGCNLSPLGGWRERQRVLLHSWMR